LVHDLDEMVASIPRIDEIDRNVTRMHIEEHFSAQVMARQYIEIYEKLAKTWDNVPQLRFAEPAMLDSLLTPAASSARIASPVQSSSQASTVAAEVEPVL